MLEYVRKCEEVKLYTGFAKQKVNINNEYTYRLVDNYY